MFERFTDRARQVTVLAQEEARMHNHDNIGTEHILLALVQEGHGVAAQTLESLGITQEAVRQQVEEIIGPGQQAPRGGHIPFTPRAKKVLQLSLREAMQLGHAYIGTEHILLGLIREGEGVAAQVLVRLGADRDRVRQQVIHLLEGYQGEDEPGTARTAGRAGQGRRGDQEIAQVRRDKESAIDAEDFENAAALRDREKQLLVEKASRQKEWTTAHTDLPSLSDEVERLRDLLRQQGIDPQDGAA